MSNLIISLMSGYTECRSIEVFIKSALKTRNDVTVLYDKMGDELIEGLKKKYPEANLIPYASYIETHNVQKNLSPFNLKYIILYLHVKFYLKEKYKHILFSDVSDVYFQSDPFMGRKFHDVFFFAERLKIGQCITNSLWCAQSYGYKQLAEHYDKPIVNTGVMIAKHEKLIPFLKGFLKELEITISQGRLDIADQVSMTHYYNKNCAVCGLYELTGEICAHLAQDVEMGDIGERIKLEGNSILYMGNKTPIIHQYVRIPNLAETIYQGLGV